MAKVAAAVILISLASIKVSARCNHFLGLSDGAVFDFQITATSAFPQNQPHEARPHGRGWCARFDDSTPYLQVDFISTLTVEGILLSTKGSYGSVFEGNSGNFPFAVDFGTNLTELRRLPQSFHINPFYKPEHFMQRFLFTTPLNLRYLRIYPFIQTTDTSLVCLRLEVIGCRTPDPLGIGRVCSSPKHWYSLSSLIVPYPSWGSFSKKITENWSECLSSCQDIPRCYSVVYHYNTTECDMYIPSAAHSYKLLSVVGKNAEAFLGICGTDEYFDSHSESSSPITELSWEDKTQTKPGIIVSFGYPFYYQTGMSDWTIYFAEGTYGNLLFSNISLNFYAVEDSVCEDEIILLQKKGTDLSFKRFSYYWNNQQFSWRTEVSTIFMTFKTCDAVNRISEQGIGFRALAYSSDTPTCIDNCRCKEAKIVSPSFLGDFSSSEIQLWSFCDPENGRMFLEFTDFNVRCKTGTSFQLTLWNTESSHCNMNKPLYPLSTWFFMAIKFILAIHEQDYIVEGFTGHYWMRQTHNMTILSTSFVTVCSEELRKCFRFYYFRSNDKSWNIFKSTMCEAQDMYVASIHSKLEQSFITFYLLRFGLTWDHETSYIGLKREKGDFIWSDGSHVTYTAWGERQPSLKSQKLECTVINITTDINDTFWQSASCDLPVSSFGVCHYLIPPGPKTRSETTQRSLTSDVIDIMPVKEPSLYFACGDGEIISIVGKCDGRRDCNGGRDEESCDNSSSCTVNEYRCSDGTCVDVSALCDYFPDCHDGQDENCDFAECSVTDGFQCNSKLCIDRSLRCDGKPDCFSGEDELQCDTCNASTSFKCGDDSDLTCLPLKYRCDGIPDCLFGDDEVGCFKPNTCQKWWDIGYRSTGIYDIGGDDIECDYSEISSANRRIISRYHNVDFEPGAANGRFFVSFKSYSVLGRMKGNNCSFSFDQLCHPWIEELYNVDRNGSGSQNSQCRCLRMIMPAFGFYKSHIEDCEGRNITDLNFAVNIWQTSEQRFTIGFPHAYRRHGTSSNSDIRIRLNPFVCYTDFLEPPPSIVCGNGIVERDEVKCLYRISEFGTMIGCRSLAHLQGCESFHCPHEFFKCPKSFCLENRFVCDGEMHCPGGEDEQNCGTPMQKCVSQYRCLQSHVCLSVRYLCDGIRQCPMGDDERFCNFRCPQNCICKGMAADCKKANVDVDQSTLSNNTKSLDISTNPVFFSLLKQYSKSLIYLIYLNMSACNVSVLSNNIFRSMRNLLELDLSYNSIRVFSSNLFVRQHRLKKLLLVGNIEIHAIETMAFYGLNLLKQLEIKHAHIGHIYKDAFRFLNLETLDMTNNTIDRVENHAFKGCTVADIFLSGTVIKSFDNGMFLDLNITDTLVTDSHKFCCIKPYHLQEKKCYPHRDEFSSCSDLMRNGALRLLLWIIGTCSLVGNAASLIYRFVFDRQRLKLGYGIFVSNLAVADFLMGVYLITIAAADVTFRGTYIFNDESWKRSAWCNMAGVLSAMSSEASVLFICLITMDRILVVKYPFGRIRFTRISSIVCSCIVWFVVAMLAILPILITSYFKNSFYSKTGVCLALPLTRDRPPGWGYSIGIFIGFNFVTFLFIAAGQWLIYRTIESSRSKMKSVSTARANDLRVARNLLLVATTDFLCWFPVGILGILALTNHVIPGDVYAWTAVLVLPVNSALNPFLYTLSAIIGRGKFTPDTDEQSRPTVVSIDVFDVLKNKMFIPPSYASLLLPLTDYLEKKRFKPKKCLLTAVTVAKCLAMLHERDICHTNLSMQDLYRKPTKKGSFAVALLLDPKLANKEDEKREEIAKFGRILDALLKSCQDQSPTPGTSATTKL